MVVAGPPDFAAVAQSGQRLRGAIRRQRPSSSVYGRIDGRGRFAARQYVSTSPTVTNPWYTAAGSGSA